MKVIEVTSISALPFWNSHNLLLLDTLNGQRKQAVYTSLLKVYCLLWKGSLITDFMLCTVKLENYHHSTMYQGWVFQLKAQS